MIGPGWVPRPFARLRKRTFAYTRMRARSRRAKKTSTSSAPAHNEIVIFDHRPAEFPLATALPRAPKARVLAALGHLHRWLGARWEWLKPRTVPVIVAAIGMIFVLLSADYLAHAHGNQQRAVNVVLVR